MILNKLLSIEYVASLHINTGALQLFIMTVWINILLAVVWSRYFSQLMIQWNVSAFVANSSYTCFCVVVPVQVMYLFLHTVKGTPFETPDQGKARLLTHWEQMDYGVQFTSSRKFLTISPIVL